MNSNLEKFKALVSPEKTDTIERNRERIKNRARLRESQNIALKVLIRLDELGWTQRQLATQMDVLPQQITKIVSGKENLTLDTIVKLQQILTIPLLASFYEKKVKTEEGVSDQSVRYSIQQSSASDSVAKIKYATPGSNMSVAYRKFNDQNVA